MAICLLWWLYNYILYCGMNCINVALSMYVILSVKYKTIHNSWFEISKCSQAQAFAVAAKTPFHPPPPTPTCSSSFVSPFSTPLLFPFSPHLASQFATTSRSTVVQSNHELRRKYWATRFSVRSFARTAHSFACSGLLASRPPLRSLVRSLARSLTSLTPSLVGKWIFNVSKWPGFVP